MEVKIRDMPEQNNESYGRQVLGEIATRAYFRCWASAKEHANGS